MRVVVDTNVLISGLLLPDSQPGRIVAAWTSGRLEVVVSEPLLGEIARVLAYPKIARRLGWDAKRIDWFVALLRFRTTVVDIRQVTANVPGDAGDDFVLATLVASGADWLISGDEDLLTLAGEHPILSPSGFADRFL